MGASLPISQGHATLSLTATANGTMRYASYIEIYRTNPWVWSSVQAIGRGLSRLPIHAYEEQADGSPLQVRGVTPGKKAGARSSQALDRLLRKPSIRQSRKRQVMVTAVDCLIFGNGLWEKKRDGNGQPTDLPRLPWKDIEVQTTLDGAEILWFTYRPPGVTPRRLVPEDVIHFSTSDDPALPIGASPMSALKYTAALHDAIGKHNVHFFENSARPSGNLKLQPGARGDALESIRNQFRELYTSPENAGKVLVTTGDFQPLTMGADHSGIIELIKLSREEIAATFRIPPPILGLLEKAIMSNVKELREQYLRDVIGPWASIMEDPLEDQLAYAEPYWMDLDVRFDLDEMLRPDLEARAIAYNALEATLTTNERRFLEGKPRLEHPEADTVWMPSGAIPVGIKPPEPDPAAAPAEPAEPAAPAAPAK
jgi:HK97 family phage portal protein